MVNSGLTGFTITTSNGNGNCEPIDGKDFPASIVWLACVIVIYRLLGLKRRPSAPHTTKILSLARHVKIYLHRSSRILLSLATPNRTMYEPAQDHASLLHDLSRCGSVSDA